MLTGVTRHPLQCTGQLDQFMYILLFLVTLAQIVRLLQRLVQRHPQIKRDQLGDTIHHAVGVTLYTSDITHHRLGVHSPVGDDLRDPVDTIGLGHVADHLVTSVHAEVDIEVGHGDTLRVEEALEQQLILQRIEVGDQQGIGDQ